MKDNRNTSKKDTDILVYVLSTIFVFILAYIDYLTSDYSLVLFYIVLIVASTWYTNIVFGFCIATLCAIVEAVSDYYVHSDAVFNSLYYLNWTCNILIYMSLSITIYYVRLKHDNK